jgi:prepilin-type N-terminal cleavage/methylation domain-containing protein
MQRTASRSDRGFTLVELLIVIVILGVLAVVTVFAVRGITDEGQENAEGADLRNLVTGIDAYWLEHGHNPTETELVSGEYLTAASEMHDIVVDGDGSYSIVNVRTGTTVDSGAPTGTAPTTTEPAPVTTVPPVGPAGWLGNATTVAGVPAVTYGSGAQVELQIGGPTIRADWNAMVTAGEPTPNGRTYILVDASLITTPELARAVASAAVGYFDFDIYPVDDTAAIDNAAFAPSPCVYDFLRDADDIARRPDRAGGSVIR